MASGSTRVLLTSNFAIIMSAIEALLSRSPDLAVVGASADLPALTKKFRSLKPDVLLADIVEVDQGLCLLSHIAEEFPDARTVILSAIEDPRFARTLLNKGVSGYVLKSSTEAELVLAIRYAGQGRKFLDPALVDTMFAMAETGPPAHPNGHRCPGLSQREVQVLHAIVGGCTNREIALDLHVSTKTVETYRARIYTKLRLKSRFDLVRYAIENGLISLHQTSSDAS